MKKYKEIKASDELPGVGIYNCLYNGDHCIFQVHDGGFRIINYHGEKEDAPKLNLVKWLKEDEQDEGWVFDEDQVKSAMKYAAENNKLFKETEPQIEGLYDNWLKTLYPSPATTKD